MRPGRENHLTGLIVEREVLDVDVAHALVDDMSPPCLVAIVSYLDVGCEAGGGFQTKSVISAVEMNENRLKR